MRVYNSLTRKLEDFAPINQGTVGLYACGPTVYDYPTIGNWRTYVLADLMVRDLIWSGLKVTYIMNLTDVGHLTGDNSGDADLGEDRMEKGAKREGKTAWEIANFYIQDFYSGFNQLNLSHPFKFTKATDHIGEQIELVSKIEAAGFAYKISDGIYFDVSGYEKAGNSYGELSTLDKIEAGKRVEVNPEKKDPRDFALWKLTPAGVKRQMEWDSPWGKGFPGWHIECSAMSLKYLGDQFDLHLGGEDLRTTHHPNEIAQSEAATGKKPFVKYWLHGAHLLVDGGRMGKSLGNAYTLADLAKKGFSALELKYFYLTAHYRKPLNFTFAGLTSAAEAYRKLKSMVAAWQGVKGRTQISPEKLAKVQAFSAEFKAAIGEDLNMPQVLAVVWAMAKSNIPETDKLELITDWDLVLGLNLTIPVKKVEISNELKALIDKREELRKEGKYEEADKLRSQIEAKGFKIEDKHA